MINSLEELGHCIERAWAKENDERALFSQISYDHLAKFSNRYSLEELEKDLAVWLANSKLPKQLNIYNNFGQPPVTIFNNSKFVIDLYFWTDIDTSIHSHSFSGAFKVLYALEVRGVGLIVVVIAHAHKYILAAVLGDFVGACIAGIDSPSSMFGRPVSRLDMAIELYVLVNAVLTCGVIEIL